MSSLRPIWLNLALLAVVGLQADAVFAQVFSGVQQHPVASRTTYGPNYFTIMGHVARPNTYELPTSQPNLAKFVTLAGELTKTASRQIRIIRDGRLAQTTFYTEKSEFSLAPGDIAVVLGNVGQRQLIHRGNQSPTTAAGSEVSLAITGIRDYPIVLSIPSERATVRWITRQLGLDPGVANHVKAITQRQSDQVFPDTRLSTGTVLSYDPAMIDASRLPDNLPVPVKIGRPANPPWQPRPSIGPLTEQQMNQRQLSPTGSPVANHQQSAAPGRALVPDIRPPAQNTNGPTENLNLPPEEQTFVKQLLTDPDSVPLDEPTPAPSGQAFVSRPPVKSPQPTGAARITDNSSRSENSEPTVGGMSGSDLADEDMSDMNVFVPEATRPYRSAPATPEPLQSFGSSRQNNTAPDSLPEDLSPAPGGFPEARPIHIADHSSQTTTDVSQNKQVTPGHTGSTFTAPAESIATGDGSRLLPPPPGGLNWPVISILTVGLLGAIAASFLIYSIAHETPKPRVVQIDTSGRYWLDRMIENDIPTVEETVDYPHNTQLFGKPAPMQRIDAGHNAIPRPHFSAPGGKSGVLQASPAIPDAPSPDMSDSDTGRIVRIHAGRPSQRQSALAEPTPDSPSPVTAPRRASFTASTDSASADSVSPTEIETAVFGDAGRKTDSRKDVRETSSKTDRQFRIDTGHQTADLKAENSTVQSVDPSTATVESSPSETAGNDAASPPRPRILQDGERTRSRTTSARRPVAVQPSPVIVQGANLLDRILSAVDQDQPSAANDSNEGRSDAHSSDERGNS